MSYRQYDIFGLQNRLNDYKLLNLAAMTEPKLLMRNNIIGFLKIN